jgi:hypothetical protein
MTYIIVMHFAVHTVNLTLAELALFKGILPCQTKNLFVLQLYLDIKRTILDNNFGKGKGGKNGEHWKFLIIVVSQIHVSSPLLVTQNSVVSPFLFSKICVFVPFLSTQIWLVLRNELTTQIWVPRNGTDTQIWDRRIELSDLGTQKWSGYSDLGDKKWTDYMDLGDNYYKLFLVFPIISPFPFHKVFSTMVFVISRYTFRRY